MASTSPLARDFFLSFYIRLILKAKDKGLGTKIVGTALHSYIRKSPKDGITILKKMYG